MFPKIERIPNPIYTVKRCGSPLEKYVRLGDGSLMSLGLWLERERLLAATASKRGITVGSVEG